MLRFRNRAPFGSFGEIGESTLQTAVASFRHRISVRSGRSTRRYRLPWLRFVNGFRFVRGVHEAVQITVDFGSFGEIHEALRITVASFRQRVFGSFGETTRRYRLSWLRFVEWPGATANGFARTPWVRFARDSGNWVRFVKALQIAVASFRGFVSSATFGSFGETARRYKLPWLRFVNGFRFVPGKPPGVKDCRGFVS